MINHEGIKTPERTIYADDQTESVGLLLRLRLPWLLIGLILGLGTTFIVSRFEALIAKEVSIAFFIPIIVYVSGAVGSQTMTIYVRNLTKRRTRFSAYLLKELLLGIILGIVFGALISVFALMWLESKDIALAVGLGMAASVATATIVGLIIPNILKYEHQDPAIGAGPFTTVVLDIVSLLIYFAVAQAIVL